MAESTEGAPEAYYDDVYRFVRRRSASAEDAEDVTQAVFVDAAAALGKLRTDEGSVLAWLYVVARRRLVDHARQRRRATLVPLDENTTGAAAPEYGRDVRRALVSSICQLPATQRTVVVGRLLEGASFAELGHRLELSEEAVQMRFVRALASLREALRKEGYAP